MSPRTNVIVTRISLGVAVAMFAAGVALILAGRPAGWFFVVMGLFYVVVTGRNLEKARKLRSRDTEARD